MYEDRGIGALWWWVIFAGLAGLAGHFAGIGLPDVAVYAAAALVGVGAAGLAGFCAHRARVEGDTAGGVAFESLVTSVAWLWIWWP